MNLTIQQDDKVIEPIDFEVCGDCGLQFGNYVRACHGGDTTCQLRRGFKVVRRVRQNGEKSLHEWLSNMAVR